MNEKYVSGIDIGTTGVKVIIFDLFGKEMGNAYREYGCIFPQSGWVEQDGEYLWEETCGAINDAIKKSGVSPEEIVSVGLSTQRCTLVPVDRYGNALRMSISWQDRRSVRECDTISRIIGAERYYEITGLPIDTTWSLSKIMWIRDNEPDIYNKTFKFALDQERILFKLGADDFYEDASNGSLQGLMDINSFKWSSELIKKLNIDREKLPKLIQSAQQVGVISKEASEKCGLREGMPIVTGGGDQQCAGVGAGVIKPNTVEVTLGTAGVTLAFLDQPLKDEQRRIPCSAHAVPGKWESEGLQLAAGSVYKWYRNNIADAEVKAGDEIGIDPYDLINMQISKVPVGSKGVLCIPYFAGSGAPNWDPYARGTFIGLNLSHSKHVLARAIIEGITFETKEILDAIEALGIDIEEIIITGGATKSDLWNQIQADIYGIPCRKLANEQATCLGAAILGSVGAGVYDTLEIAVENMVKFAGVFTPNGDNNKTYNKIFNIYKSAYKSLKEAHVYKDLVELGL